MTKDTIDKIIAHNRRPFAAHQLWVEFERLHKLLERAVAVMDYEARIHPEDFSTGDYRREALEAARVAARKTT